MIFIVFKRGEIIEMKLTAIACILTIASVTGENVGYEQTAVGMCETSQHYQKNIDGESDKVQACANACYYNYVFVPGFIVSGNICFCAGFDSF